MKFLANLSIRNKIAGIILLATLLSLGTGFFLVFLGSMRLFERELVRTTERITRVTGDFNSVNLHFDERDMAVDALAQLERDKYIADAHLYDAEGRHFASFKRSAEYEAPATLPASADDLSCAIAGDFVVCTSPVTFEGERYGTIYLRGTTAALAEQRRQQLTIMAVLMAALVVGSVALAYLLQGFVSHPILHLAEQTQRISADNDYSVRVVKPGNDEIGTLYDHFNEMLAQIQQRQEELERSNRDLDQFAYVASHDLKAPLRAIATLAGWIEEDLGEKLTGEAKEQMELLRSRVARMDALIEGVLQYSRVGRMGSPGEEVDVGELLRELIGMLAPPPGFRIEVAPDMPVLVTKRFRLGQVFSNLIDNAVKYHDRSEGAVRVRAESLNGFYEFTVEDDGPGIACEHHDRVFVMFQTLQPRDEVESTGLGLALVKKLVEEEGGKITLESGPGRGSRFRFTWPATPPAPGNVPA